MGRIYCEKVDIMAIANSIGMFDCHVEAKPTCDSYTEKVLVKYKGRQIGFTLTASSDIPNFGRIREYLVKLKNNLGGGE